MTLYQGATTIDAVYFGNGVATGAITRRSGTSASLNGPGTLTASNAAPGDLHILIGINPTGKSLVATPAGFTLWQSMVSSNSDHSAALFYTWAGNLSGAGNASYPVGAGSWSIHGFRSVDTATAIGSQTSQETATGTVISVPGSTMTNTDGSGIVSSFVALKRGATGTYSTSAQPGYDAVTLTGPSPCYTRLDTTTAAVAPFTVTATTNGGTINGGFAWTVELLPKRGSSPLAQAVYLGDEKVWPIYVGNLSPWYKPPSTTGGGNAMTVAVPWPVGAEFCDAILIGGGAGGTGTGVGGNPQRGGGEGAWSGMTIPRLTGTNGMFKTELRVVWQRYAGKDGAGGGNFNTEAADGSKVEIVISNNTGTGGGIFFETAHAADKTSNTGNRNGGNVAPTFTFNGRTYTLASYGAGAGQGGATSNKNGGNGNAPGGGGQSADNGGLTGYNGGAGAHGAAILYWY